jgi:hypothetical protein
MWNIKGLALRADKHVDGEQDTRELTWNPQL